MRAFSLVAIVVALVVAQVGAVEYHEWLTGNSYWDPRVDVRSSGDSRLGVFAAEDLSANTTLFRIPDTEWVHGEWVRGLEQFKPFAHLLKENTLAVAVWLLTEMNAADQGKETPWTPWVKTLPTSLDSPFLWSDEELQELMGSSTLATALTTKLTVNKVFEQLQVQLFEPFRSSGLFPEELTTAERWNLAYGNVITRVWSVGGYGSVSVPLVDMWNHDEEGGIAAFQDGWTLTLRNDVKKGDEIFLNYGPKKNPSLFTTYGFLLNSSFDAAQETLRSSPSSWEVGTLLKDTAFERFLSSDRTMFQHQLEVGEATLDRLALPFARSSVLQFSDLSHATLNRLKNGQAVSLANEAKALRSLLVVLRQKLNLYKTTVEEDEELLQQELPPRLRTAVTLRLGEKRVLQKLSENFIGAWNRVLLEGSLPTDPTLMIL